jgi:hypothetical protein
MKAHPSSTSNTVAGCLQVDSIELFIVHAIYEFCFGVFFQAASAIRCNG